MKCSVCPLPDQSLCPLKASCDAAEYVWACEKRDMNPPADLANDPNRYYPYRVSQIEDKKK